MAEKILIVDDDLETLRLVGLMLQKHGFSIVAAHNGIQAIKVAQAERPDVIVLDIMMPDMDGYQVTRELRKLAETANTPILMFTAKTQVDDKVAGYEAGVDDSPPPGLAGERRKNQRHGANCQAGLLPGQGFSSQTKVGPGEG